jgi:hypothetical protein
MSDSAAAPPRKRSWWRLALGLVPFLAVPLVPQLRVIFPIEQTLILVAGALAACMVVGWTAGGKLSHAMIWLAVAGALLAWPSLSSVAHSASLERTLAASAGTGYWSLARGWTLLVAASFGIVGLFTAGQPFIARALATLAVSTGVGFILILLSPGGPTRIHGTMAVEYTRRNAESIAQIHEGAATAPWKDQVNNSPTLQRLNEMTEQNLLAIPQWSSILVPAILALETLAALALAWALYHRLSPVPLGSPLGRLQEFRFNDQLVWGVAVGASIYLLPAFAEAKNAGLNIFAFFGSLYVLRGLGILGWMSRGRKGRLIVALVSSFFFAVVLADSLGFLISPIFPIALLAFALGLGDTWLDWRTLLQPKAV